MGDYRRDTSSKVRRKTPTHQRYSKSILVFTEGENTEPIYLDALKRLLGSKLIYIETRGSGMNDPKGLVDEALIYKKRHASSVRKGKVGFQKPNVFDETWVVFDADALSVQQLNSGIAYAYSKKIRVAFSNPCFEFWLMLHSENGYTTSSMCNRGAVEQKMKTCYSLSTYSKDESSTNVLMKVIVNTANIQRALKSVERLKAHHQSAGSTVPFLPFTTVNELILSINEGLPDFKKILTS